MKIRPVAPAPPVVKSLTHLGLVAAAVDGLKLVERIDERLPLDEDSGVKVTHGQRIKAMIINGLGYTTSPLYLTPDFLKAKTLSAYWVMASCLSISMTMR